MRSGRVAILSAVMLASCSTAGAPTSTMGATTTVAPITTPGPSTTLAPAPTPPEALPPHTFEALAPLLTPLVAPLGFRVTRAALVDLDTYVAAAAGTHLAVYVEPLAERDRDTVAAATVPLAVAFLPGVFLRWSGLESFDICQEPFGQVEGETAPPDTILNLTREAALAIDWATVTLADLIHRPHIGLSLYAAETIRLSDTWSEAEAGRA